MPQPTAPDLEASTVLPSAGSEEAPDPLAQLDSAARLTWVSIYYALLDLTRQGYSVDEVKAKLVTTLWQVRASVGFNCSLNEKFRPHLARFNYLLSQVAHRRLILRRRQAQDKPECGQLHHKYVAWAGYTHERLAEEAS